MIDDRTLMEPIAVTRTGTVVSMTIRLHDREAAIVAIDSIRTELRRSGLSFKGHEVDPTT